MADQIRIFLPVFIVAFLGSAYLWDYFQGKKSILYKENKEAKRRKIGKIYKMLTVASVLVIFLFSFFPHYYNYLYPINALDRPYINNSGILILKISFIASVMVQINIDLWLSRISEFQFQHIVNFPKFHFISTKLHYIVMIGMFTGLFITISSLVAASIALLSIITYIMEFKLLYKIKI
jgi:hypothetical protein